MKVTQQFTYALPKFGDVTMTVVRTPGKGGTGTVTRAIAPEYDEVDVTNDLSVDQAIEVINYANESWSKFLTAKSPAKKGTKTMVKRMKKGEFDSEKERGVYDAEFYEKSAAYYAKALPGIRDFLLGLSPTSVCDVGCGNGDMLATLLADGIDLLGIDFSDGAVATQKLPATNFLNGDLTKPLTTGRPWDVVCSWEVWEHLPAEFEDMYLDNIIKMDPRVIVISCANPRQWGRRHYNPHELDYVIDKMLTLGYRMNSDLTERFKKIKYLASFYRQNTIVCEKIV